MICKKKSNFHGPMDTCYNEVAKVGLTIERTKGHPHNVGIVCLSVCMCVHVCVCVCGVVL